MTVLWDSAGLRDATGGTIGDEVRITGVCIDSRSAGPGDLFIALRDVRDGHDFVADALARGAAAAMWTGPARGRGRWRGCFAWATRWRG